MAFATILVFLSVVLQLSAAAPSASSKRGTDSTDSAACSARTYDYIIVGGGTAGNAVAVRLSQQLPHSSILVIEAGPAAPDELGINIPGKKGSTLGGKYDWNFTTTAQPGLKNRTIGANRGKVLGGTSALNLLVYDRAASVEYDAWEDVGNPGWNWNSMSAAMTRSENYTGGPPGSGTTGPVHAVINREVPAHQAAFIPVLTDTFGIPANGDSLQGTPIGAMFQPSCIDPTHYNRSYSANAYLPLAGSNLKVLTETTVAKVNFRRWRSRQIATGVTLQNGTVFTARQEVILSAGAIQSPNLLELSGVGQSAVLAAANITQLINLPGVGENYQDHLRIGASYQLKDNYTSFDIFKYNATFNAAELAKWIAGDRSLWDYTASGYAFLNWGQVVGNDTSLKALAQTAVGSSTDVGQQKKLAYLNDPTVPQVEIIFSDGYTGVKGYPASGTSLYGKGFFTLLAGLMHPLSRGSVHINPTNPSGKPIINPNYLNNQYDLQAMAEMVKFVRRIANAEPLKSVWVAEYEPGVDLVPTADEEAWRQYALNTTLSIYHPLGTCAMLPLAKGGVVDSSLTVYGTTNLRVVDASVIPVQISAHIQTAVYGIAEMAADLIVAART